MKKHFLSLVLVFGLAFVLVGCGKTEKPAPATTKAPVATTQAPVVTTEPGTTARPTTAAPTTTEHLVHSFGDEYEHDENLHWKECSICHDPSAKEPHEFVDETVTKATDTVEGVVRHTCSVCGYSYEENIGLAYVWEVKDGEYLYDFASKQNDSHFTITYSEDHHTATIAAHSDWNWNALVAYAKGSTAGYGLKITVTTPADATAVAKFVIKPNDVEPSWVWNNWAPVGETRSFYYAGSDIPATMEKMVVMAAAADTVGDLSMQWVRLEYTTSYVFNANTKKIDQVIEYTTEGFAGKKAIVRSFELDEATVQGAKMAYDAKLNMAAPVIMTGVVSGVDAEDTKGAITMSATIDGVEYSVTTTELAKLGTLFGYTVANDALSTSVTSIANFKELGVKNGDEITVLGIIKVEGETAKLYGELLSIKEEIVQELPEAEVVTLTGFGTGSESVYPSIGVQLDEGNKSGSIKIASVPSGTFGQWCRVEFAALPAKAQKVILVVTGNNALTMSAKVDGDGNPHDGKTGNKTTKTLNGEKYVIFEWDLEALGIDPTTIKKVVLWASSTDLAGQESSFRVEMVGYVEKQELPEAEVVTLTGFGTGSESVYPSTGVQLDEGNKSGSIKIASVLASSTAQWCRVEFANLPANAKKVILVLTGPSALNVMAKVDGDGNPHDGKTGNKTTKALNGDKYVIYEWDLEALGIDPTTIKKVVLWAGSESLAGQESSFRVEMVGYTLPASTPDPDPEPTAVLISGFTTGGDSVYPSAQAVVAEDHKSGSFVVASIPASMGQWCRFDFPALSAGVKKVTIVVTGTEGMSLGLKLDGDGNPYDGKTGNKQYKALSATEVAVEWDLEALEMDPTKIVKVVFWAYSSTLSGQEGQVQVKSITFE